MLFYPISTCVPSLLFYFYTDLIFSQGLLLLLNKRTKKINLPQSLCPLYIFLCSCQIIFLYFQSTHYKSSNIIIFFNILILNSRIAYSYCIYLMEMSYQASKIILIWLLHNSQFYLSQRLPHSFHYCQINLLLFVRLL